MSKASSSLEENCAGTLSLSRWSSKFCALMKAKASCCHGKKLNTSSLSIIGLGNTFGVKEAIVCGRINVSSVANKDVLSSERCKVSDLNDLGECNLKNGKEQRRRMKV